MTSQDVETQIYSMQVLSNEWIPYALCQISQNRESDRTSPQLHGLVWLSAHQSLS